MRRPNFRRIATAIINTMLPDADERPLRPKTGKDYLSRSTSPRGHTCNRVSGTFPEFDARHDAHCEKRVLRWLKHNRHKVPPAHIATMMNRLHRAGRLMPLSELAWKTGSIRRG